MNTVKMLSLAIASIVLTASCKEAPANTDQTETETVIEQQMAFAEEMTEGQSEAAEESTTALYVTARTGLSLREYENLNSEKLAIIPYGTKLEVLDHEDQMTMKVNHIKGGMDKVQFNRKTGYVFNGYLSQYFPPEEDMLPDAYAKELKEEFPKVEFGEVVGGSSSKPVNTSTLLLPKAKWHEAYFIAQQVFDIPNEFTFPKQIGSKSQVIKGPKKENESWFDALNVSRDKVGLTAIIYSFDSKKLKRTVSITETEKGIQIQQIRAYK